MRYGLLLLVLLASVAHAQQTNPDQLLKIAMSEQQHGDFPGAVRDYRKVLALRPDMLEAKVNLGAALAHLGQYDEAIALYRSALPALSFKNPVLLDLGLAYFKKGDFADAREQFEALHHLEPHDVRTAILLGDTYIRLLKPEAAVALLEPLKETASQNLDFEYVYGSALIGVGRRRDGVAHVQKVAQASDSADAYLLAGATLLQLNEFEQARRDLETALRLNPNLPNIYTLVGTAEDKTGNTSQAETDFREALKISPGDFEANLYLGGILYNKRQLPEAKIYLDRALQIRPQDFLARYESAMWKSTSGQYESAAADLESLVKDDPDWLEPHVELASLYYKLHRPADGARERQVVDRLTAEQQARGPGK